MPRHRGNHDERLLSRRQLVRTAGAGAVLLASGALAGCGTAAIPGAQAATDVGGSRGGRLRVGVVGGSAKDTLDAHGPVTHPDEARVINLYDTLLEFDHDYRLQPALAESVEANKEATVWTVRLRPGLEFGNGKTITADDVVATIRRIADPQDPKSGAAGFAAVDLHDLTVLDNRTVRLHLKTPDATLDDQFAQYSNGIVPADYDPKRPVGSGAFTVRSFQPGLRSVFSANRNYWRPHEPQLGELVIIDFPDDTARVNALLGGQVDAIDQLPIALINVINGDPGLQVLESQTGAWLPFTMRVDTPPFDDARVRQALRLVVDREQMINQVLSGHGRIANDLYSPFDPCYDTSLPQRHQNIDKARSLLRQAGKEDLSVELVTSPVAAGLVEAAQVFARQAAAAGVNVHVRKVDPGEFYGDKYLKWPFAQDFWFTRNFLPQASSGSMPDAPYNETHWNNKEFISLVRQAKATVDREDRCRLIQQAQQIEHESGGYIIWGFTNQVDAYNVRVHGLRPDRSGIPLSGYKFRQVSFGS
ncbi:MAG TPA: ABC transporter substrate-binding protein [Segeticoccus sp.]|uniref:ABC transporter substrate-binding protein n=1 Tax=Segeticoccus sp. TaxID=2706531 RepID=UPI002D7F1F0B|nr:ABC transporter substrate-binding protein [Segeticoccus sp.]HET8599907.1 ABC transporter substrate-binding protein [Segeticoccus sp.]